MSVRQCRVVVGVPHTTGCYPAMSEIELLVLPYDSATGQSLLHRLISEIESGNWKRFRAAVAFAKSSGNYDELLSALLRFARNGGPVEMTFGADVFGGDVRGSDFDAVRRLLIKLGDLPTVRIHLYHEAGRTFHPKVYLFDAEAEGRALAVIGSSNWSYGGLVDNVEVNVLLRLDLSAQEQLVIYERLSECFATYWKEQ